MSYYQDLDCILAETAYPGPLQQHDHSVAVKRLQEWLTFHQYGLVIDGDYGPATHQALTRFRQHAGLPTDGPLSLEDWQCLIAPMINALQCPPPDTTLPETVLKIALQHLRPHPVELGGENRGPWVRLYCNGQEGKEMLWCAGFVSFVLKQACAVQGVELPLPGSLSCDALAQQAKQRGRFVFGGDIDSGNTPWSDLDIAWIFLWRGKNADDWTHTGIGFEGVDHTFRTVEGNTNHEGFTNGYEVCSRDRAVTHCDFISLR